jgi:glycosyltransferase involved in cell wall biosynthesis
MIFAIEALGLTGGGGKAGLMRLVPALARHTEHRFVVMLADLPEFAALARRNVKLMVRRKPASLLAREMHLQRAVPRICAAERADALLCLGNFAPRRSILPAVVLLHNAHYVSPDARAEAGETLRERLIRWYGRRMLRRLPPGVRLVVQTALMQERVIAAYPHLGANVVVVPDGEGLSADAANAPGDGPGVTPGPTPGAAAADRHAGRSQAPFTFVCPAHYYPHKNLEALVEAFRLLPACTGRAACCLLTLDARQHPRAGRLLQTIEREGLTNALVNLGPLGEASLAQAYRTADAFILPTLLESFGRTYREAMRLGLPILTSDRDFARQACGDAALYFDPLRPASIARAMAEIMESGELRSRLASAGKRRAGLTPSWDAIAGQFVRILEEAAAERRGCGVRDLDLCRSWGNP